MCEIWSLSLTLNHFAFTWLQWSHLTWLKLSIHSNLWLSTGGLALFLLTMCQSALLKLCHKSLYVIKGVNKKSSDICFFHSFEFRNYSFVTYFVHVNSCVMYNRAVKWSSLFLACFAALGFKKKSEYYPKPHKSPQVHSRVVWTISVTVGGKTPGHPFGRQD